MTTGSLPETCPRCNIPNQRLSLFCDNCRLYLRDETMTVERCTFTRRFFGNDVLEGVLATFTLIIGWFIWLIFTSKTGQTPAKRLVNTYAINVETGRQIGRGETWLREVVVKLIAITILGAIVPFAGVVDALWVFFDKNRQALHDKILSQVVVYAPAGLPESMRFQQNAPLLYVAPPIIPERAPVPPPTSSLKTVADDLRELARLRDDGIITTEEYERKRDELASKM